jgi:hypothetical protein
VILKDFVGKTLGNSKTSKCEHVFFEASLNCVFKFKMEFDFENVVPANSGQIIEAASSRLRMSYRFSVGDTSDEVYSCRFDPADRFVAVAGKLGIIRIYHLLTGKIVSELHDP